MKNRGFTLVELLAVIAILAAVSLIVIFNVTPVLNESKENVLEDQKKNIEEAAKVYYLKEGNMSVESSCVNLSSLIKKGYVEADKIIDPTTKQEMDGSVNITYINNQYKYEYSDSNCAPCRMVKADTNDKFVCGDQAFYIISNNDQTITALSAKTITFKEKTIKQVNNDESIMQGNLTKYDGIDEILRSYENYLKEEIELKSASVRMPNDSDLDNLKCTGSPKTCVAGNIPTWLANNQPSFWLDAPGKYLSVDGAIGNAVVATNGANTPFFIRPVLVLNSSSVLPYSD